MSALPTSVAEQPLPAALHDLSLSLTLSRDQGTHHTSGAGAGSEAHSLSPAAESQHEVLAPKYLPRIQSSTLVSHALSPDNLPRIDHLVIAGLGKLPASSENGLSSTVATPGGSRSVTPTSGSATPPPSSTPAIISTTPNGSNVITPSSTSTSTTTSTTAKAPTAKPAEKEKKSVFGKLFERNNSSASLSLASSEKMDRGDSNGSSAAAGAALARKPSKKEKEAEEKARKESEKAADRAARAAASGPNSTKREASSEGRPRAESNGYLSSGGGNGMGAALTEFMRNKVSRKTSITSKRSDDGKSDRGSQAGDSQYGGSAKGGSTKGGSTKGDDNKSKSGQSTTSLLKKYGVCEKVAIGKGATAVVKLAHKWDRTTERLYAVKEFRKRRKNETEKEYVKKLTSEFCISSTLHHHNIVETVDLVQDEQSHWCEVMEYCPGGDLYAAIKKGNMSSPEINSYFKQILSGVYYLHSMGVAHRDIKPENLLLDAKGHVKITDFGVSDVFRMCWEKTTHMSKGLCGSEPYIAPEQFDQKEYDARLVDVWACAVVFYCMHFQELPWRVAKSSDPTFGPYVQMYAGSASPAPISNLVPRECRTIIKKMLDPDPRTRATTEDILMDPWFMGIVVVPPLEGVNVIPAAPFPL